MLRVLAFLLACAAPVQAQNLALVLTQAGEDDALGFLHSEIAASYAEAGFTVHGGLDLDRAAMLTEIAAAEAGLAAAEHVVVHLSGGVRAAGGLPVILPGDVDAESRAAVLAGAIPVVLLLDLLADRPGAAVLAVGRAPGGVALPQSEAVLIVDGPAQAVADVMAVRMLADGLAPSQIDAVEAGVTLSGLVSDVFQLGRAGSVAAVAATPASTEAALALSFEDRAKIQDGLALLGFDPQEIGGDFGPGTRRALQAWATAAGREASGFLTAESLAALMTQIDAAVAAQAAEVAEREAWSAANAADSIDAYRAFLDGHPGSRFADRARDRLNTLEASAEAAERVAGYRDLEQSLGLTLESVATLEARLTALGFTPGPADGRVEIQTRRSIAQFQAQAGLTPTGYLNPATIQRILIAQQ